MVTSSGSVFQVGRVLSERYRLEEALAVGGMAEVWRGHDLILERQVAIKLLHPHLASDPLLVERFRREAISAARLSHPNIVPTYDTGTDDSAAYIVLGLVAGPTLGDALEKSSLEVSQAVAVARQVADALQHAHDSGLIHRDIKPSNVLLVDNNFRVMVADFGIAKAVAESADASLTIPGFVIGTPAYVAPEQLSGAEADARSDIYAVGVLLHEMLCGHTKESQPTQLHNPDGTSVETAVCEELPPGVREIVAKATAVHAEDRYQTAAELCAELARYQSTAPAAKRSATIRQVLIDAPPGPGGNASGNPVASNSVPGPGLTPMPTRTFRQETKTAPDDRFDDRFEVDEPLRRRRRRRTVVTILTVLVLVVAAVTAGRLVGSLGGDEQKTLVPPTPFAISSARSFDPFGDKSEGQPRAALAFDNNPATAWATETYSSRKLGNLKPGVGLVLQLSDVATLNKLTIDSDSRGWAASIYVSTGGKDRLEDWGNPVDTQSGLGASAVFDLHSARGDTVLVWITDLGDANRFSLNEARLTV